MTAFYINFTGYCTVEAETKEEAEEKFWAGLQSPSTNAMDDFYDIESIEEI